MTILLQRRIIDEDTRLASKLVMFSFRFHFINPSHHLNFDMFLACFKLGEGEMKLADAISTRPRKRPFQK